MHLFTSTEIQKAYVDGAEDIIRGVRRVTCKDGRIIGGPSPAFHADEERQVVGAGVRSNVNQFKSLRLMDLI